MDENTTACEVLVDDSGQNIPENPAPIIQNSQNGQNIPETPAPTVLNSKNGQNIPDTPARLTGQNRKVTYKNPVITRSGRTVREPNRFKP